MKYLFLLEEYTIYYGLRFIRFLQVYTVQKCAT